MNDNDKMKSQIGFTAALTRLFIAIYMLGGVLLLVPIVCRKRTFAIHQRECTSRFISFLKSEPFFPTSVLLLLWRYSSIGFCSGSIKLPFLKSTESMIPCLVDALFAVARQNGGSWGQQFWARDMYRYHTKHINHS